MSPFLSKLARPLEFLLGLVFMLSAILKFNDINLFAVQIAGYGVIEDKALLGTAAVITVSMEALLGMLLLLGLRLRMFTYLFLQCLLLAFSGLVLYGWLVHDLENCGCFGSMEMSPQTTLIKNAILFLLGLLTWRGMRIRSRAADSAPAQASSGTLALKFATATLFTALIAWGSNHDLEPIVTEDAGTTADTGKYSQFQFEVDGQPFDLSQGEHLVALLDMDCEHCQASVPALNDLSLIPDLPPLVALCFEGREGDFETFRALTSPYFPMHSLGDQVRLFHSLLDFAPPGLSYVRDGREIRYWEGEEGLPTPADVLEVVHAATTPAHDDQPPS